MRTVHLSTVAGAVVGVATAVAFMPGLPLLISLGALVATCTTIDRDSVEERPAQCWSTRWASIGLSLLALAYLLYLLAFAVSVGVELVGRFTGHTVSKFWVVIDPAYAILLAGPGMPPPLSRVYFLTGAVAPLAVGIAALALVWSVRKLIRAARNGGAA